MFSQATDLFAAVPMWVLPVVGVAAVIGIGCCAAVIRARKARTVKGSAHEHAVLSWCVTHGHAYVMHNTGWRCDVCGNHVARRDGELYGPIEEGGVDRRREDRQTP